MAGLFRGAAGGTPIRFSSDYNGVAVMKRTLTSVGFAPPVTAPGKRDEFDPSLFLFKNRITNSSGQISGEDRG